MNRSGIVSILAALAAAVTFSTAAQEELVPLSGPEAPLTSDAPAIEASEAWFVELKGRPAADGGSLAAVDAEQQGFRSNARKAGLRLEERFAFKTLWNGFSIKVAPAELARLQRIEGVKAIYPVVEIFPDQASGGDEADPELATALAMTGAAFAQDTLGLTGAGVRVAVMDTGIDWHHPDLGGCFGSGCRVATGFDFVGDDFTGPGSTPVPDADPDDCGGHGSHVAGILGASPAGPGGARGVAPGVTFGAYRVFGCAGSTTADIMIAAMERALADDMQVLNMSIGSAYQWPQYPTAQAADRLVNKGVSVVTSIGNSGATGLYSASAPGVGKKVIGVASVDNTHVSLLTFTVSPDNLAIGYGPATGAPIPPTSGSFPLARTGTTASAADACNPIAGSLVGHVALIRRGTCAFHIKALNAQNAGAAGVVLYNNAAGRVNPTVAGTPAITIPVVAITAADGALIDGRIAAGGATMTWTAVRGSFVNPTGGLSSDFSSYGHAPDLSLKPDLSAPGGLIFSTLPLELGGYGTNSGTSMASPHTAGAVALLLEGRPGTSSQDVRDILQNSADPKNWWGNPGLGFLDNVHRQGAGTLDIPGAILSTVTVSPGKLSLGESEAGPVTRTLTLRNSGSAAVTFDLSHAPALATGPNTFAVGFFASFASAAFSAGSVEVPAGGSASVDVTLTAPAGLANRGQYGGYVVLTPQGGGATYRVPYAGLNGDYQSMVVLTPGASSFGNPILRPDQAFGPNGPVTLTNPAAVPAWVFVHLDHQVRRLSMEVFDANTGKGWHRAFDQDYVGRNQSATGFFAIPFDGVTVNGNKVNTLPDGQYVIRLSVLKALGDATNAAHSESWTSPVITIDRP
ncbi:MAG: S8 family serine peptidase [Nevskiaceae bacterium]